jgi:hypothetical protein
MSANANQNTREVQIRQYATLAASTLRDIADNTDIPFLKAVAGMSLLVCEAIEVRLERFDSLGSQLL